MSTEFPSFKYEPKTDFLIPTWFFKEIFKYEPKDFLIPTWFFKERTEFPSFKYEPKDFLIPTWFFKERTKFLSFKPRLSSISEECEDDAKRKLKIYWGKDPNGRITLRIC
jgi:hypothetical protein